MMEWFSRLTGLQKVGVILAPVIALFVLALYIWFVVTILGVTKSKSGFMDIPGNSNPMDVFKVSSGFNSIVNDPSRSGFSYDMQVASEDAGYRVGPGDRDTSAMTDAALAAGQK
jgi:hypothetical protein